MVTYDLCGKIAANFQKKVLKLTNVCNCMTEEVMTYLNEEK